MQCNAGPQADSIRITALMTATGTQLQLQLDWIGLDSHRLSALKWVQEAYNEQCLKQEHKQQSLSLPPVDLIESHFGMKAKNAYLVQNQTDNERK